MTLKPCPFCGGEAELFTDETGLIEICVECKQCHARTDWSLDWNDRVIPEGYVKVVRCKECKHGQPFHWEWRGKAHERLRCYHPDNVHDESGEGMDTEPNDYCSEGERKEGTNDAV